MPEFTGVITEPGLYPDVPEDVYHRDPVAGGSLSVSGAKKLIPPGCPAIYDYERRHGGKHSKSMDAGTRAHAMVLGKGEEQLAMLDYPDYKTRKAQDDKKAAIANGKIPTLPHELADAIAIRDAVFNDPEARSLLDDVTDVELSMFWRDPETGIWLRGRMDALAWRDRPVIVDLKKTKDPSPESFAKSIAEYRYDMQDRHYRDGLAAVLSGYPGELRADDIGFRFIAVGVEPPHLVMVYELGADDTERADESNRAARDTYRRCAERGAWPKWSDSAVSLSLPRYAQTRIDKENSDYFN
jgi:hypothetical protein